MKLQELPFQLATHIGLNKNTITKVIIDSTYILPGQTIKKNNERFKSYWSQL